MAEQPVFPKYIFGLHEPGGERLMEEKGKKGWILFTERIFHDPNDHHSANYSQWTNRGFGIIARINHDYFPGGTIPLSEHYDNFGRRIRNFVAKSKGCHIWIIGNEMNHEQERPKGQVITPQLYAQCYQKCWEQIHSIPGREYDQVAIGSVAPWNNTTQYPGNESGDWVQYFTDILRQIRKLNCPVDAITLHTYTHGRDPNLVYNNQKMDPPFHKYHYHFRCYVDFMEAIPQELRNIPVYITETDQDEEWENANRGWVQNAYQEINAWNTTPGNQQIRALILYRWPAFDKWAIINKPGVHEDFKAAMNHNYTWKEIQIPAEISGHVVKGAFLDFYQQTGRDFCGRPISNQVTEEGLPTQYFERVVLQQDLSGKIILKEAGKEIQTLRKTTLDLQQQINQFQDRLYELQTAITQIREQAAHSAVAATHVDGAAPQQITEVIRPLWEDVVYQLPTHSSKEYARRGMEAVRYIVINHSAVPSTVTVDKIAKFHTKNMQWPGIGYHFYIDKQGKIFKTNELTSVSYHAGRLDPISVGICVGGNFTKTVPTQAQIASTAHLVAWLLQTFSLPLDAVKGKKEFIDTQSPGHQWLAGRMWKNMLLAAIKQAQQEKAHTFAAKPLYHYLMFWQKEKTWAERDWRSARKYIGRFRVTHGFSVHDAQYAQYVTIVAKTSEVDLKAEQTLLQAGCRVERIAGRNLTQTRKILEGMALRGQRFLSLAE